MSIKIIRTRVEEQKATITLDIRGGQLGVQIDNHITVIFCCHCKTQLDNFYILDGGRYGQVGTVNCKCGAEIHCVDSDNIVEYLDTTTTFNDQLIGKYYIDFKNLYKLNTQTWTIIKEKTGYDIFIEHKAEQIELADVLEEIISKFSLEIDELKEYSSDKFYKLPELINKWFGLLDTIGK